MSTANILNSERSAGPSDESMLNHTRRIQGYGLTASFDGF